MKWLTLLPLCFFMVTCAPPDNRPPRVAIETGFGDIEVELYPEKAPVTVAAFLRYVDAGVYDNSKFYRVVAAGDMGTPLSAGVIQGGIFLNPEKKKQKGIPHESTGKSGLTHTEGVLSMARKEPGSASTEFFICLGDQSPLDSGRRGSPDGLGYAAFGKVYSGMKVVRRIQAQPAIGESFMMPITINRIRRL